MRRRITLISLVAVIAAIALPRCSSCFEDPDAPEMWIKKLEKSKSKFDREEALVNLYRIFEVTRAMADKESAYKKKLENFKKIVPKAMVKTFNTKVNGRYLLPDQIVEKLVVFESDDPVVGELFLEIAKKYGAGDAESFGDEDLQETLASKSVDGLGQMAVRGKAPDSTLAVIAEMVEQICKKGGAAAGAGAEGMDPRSFVRNAVVKAAENFLKINGARPILAKMLASIVLVGNLPKTAQDPMVTLFSINLLGDVGDVSDQTVQSLVMSLLGKGRGRRFYSFAATSVAKLPLLNGKHPALEPLMLMLKGDPWENQILAIRAKIRDEEAKTTPSKDQIKNLQAEIKPLEDKYKLKKAPPDCPFPPKHKYVCDLFWQANVEEWSKTEPGVIQMNALMVLREIGDLAFVEQMLDQYGVAATRDRWLKQVRDRWKEGGKELKDLKDTDLPGVQMQKMQIDTYGQDMNNRVEMLRALGRLNAAAKFPKARQEILDSLTWAGDPSMMVKAGEGAYLADYDEVTLKKLIELRSTAASYMTTNFKKMQVRMFFWGKVTKGTCSDHAELEFKKCLNDPPKLPGEKEVKDANWNCFEKYKPLWLAEFLHAIGYHKEADTKNLVQPFCQKEDKWWNGAKKDLEAKAAKGGAEAEDAKLRLFACQANPTPQALKKNLTFKCGVWSKCDAGTSFLCLDGHWQMRQQFHRHASLLTTHEHADLLLADTADTIMTPHTLSVKNLPEKDKSAFFDADDAQYLGYQIWDETIEKARIARAREVIEKDLCYDRRFLRVAKKCKENLDCYVSVVRGSQDMLLETEDCENLVAPFKIDASKREAPDWRAKLKALRMLAHYGQKAGAGSPGVQAALKAAVYFYNEAQNLPQDILDETREMVLIFLDRVGDFKAQKDVSCEFPYKERTRTSVREKYNLPQYEEKLAQAKKDNNQKIIDKYTGEIKKYQPKVDKEVAEATKDQACFKTLKLIIEDETMRAVKGSWQINRDARNAIGRLARRAGLRFDEI